MWRQLINHQLVTVHFADGRAEQLEVLEFETQTRSIRVGWPLHNPGVSEGMAGRVPEIAEVESANYTPLDQDGWDATVRGLGSEESTVFS